jgi:diadenosine tetraphosphate (Ap4A) HIT family hydrolase
VSDHRTDLTKPGAVRPPVPAELLDDPWFPFTGDVQVKALLPPVVPEPERHDLPEGCSQCVRADDTFVWVDEHWRLTGYRPTEIPGTVLLMSREHYDSYADMPNELLAELGPLTARIERAVLAIGGVARVHVARWGDGGAHFHLWFLPRPLGALQLRGSMLPMWLDLMPTVSEAKADQALDRIAAALRSG